MPAERPGAETGEERPEPTQALIVVGEWKPLAEYIAERKAQRTRPEADERPVPPEESGA
jgi:hypothetical protein